MLLIPLVAVVMGGHSEVAAQLPAFPESPMPLTFRSMPSDAVASGASGGARRFLPEIDAVNTSVDEVMLAAVGENTTFGQQGTLRLNVHGGFGVDIKTSDNRQGLLGVGLSYFLIDDLSFDVELNAMYFDQRGDDAWGANFNLLFRWHFLAFDHWSLYFDGGAGMLGTTDHVPANGSGFNFTPQAGLGASFDIGDDVRLMTGVRWHHISNANTFNRNPGRDSIMAYVGLSFPF